MQELPFKSKSALSLVSVDSGEALKFSKAQKWMYYKFTSNWEYMFLTLGLTINMNSFWTSVHTNSDADGSSVIHNFILLFFFGIPVCYAQVFLGQYSKLGIIYFKHLSPLGHGVGYAALLISFTWCCRFGTIASDLFMYFVACLDMELDWLECPNITKRQNEHCWSPMTACSHDCLGNNVTTSGFIYWRDIYMEGIDLSLVPAKVGLPIWKRVIPLFVIWVSIYSIINKGIEKYKKLIEVNLYIAAIIAILLLFIGIASGAASEGLRTMFYFKSKSFINSAAWINAITKVIRNLALSRACHVTLGSYLTADIPSDIMVISCLLMSFLSEIIGSMVSYAYIGVIMTEAKANYSQIVRVFGYSMAPPLTIIPLGLGTIGAPQLWTVLYILMNFIFVFNNMVIQIDVIRRSIADAHVGIRAYKNYVLIVTCGFGCLMGIFWSSKESFIMMEAYLEEPRSLIRLFDLMIMTILLFWVYSVQSLSDDIHFLQGRQPTKFWKILWYIAPCFPTVGYIYRRFFQSWGPSSELLWLQYLFYFVHISPIPICLTIEIFLHLKAHNFLGILQPGDKWGPPDPEERYLRNMFNPRQETRSRRRNDICQHNCLLHNTKFQLVVEEEKQLREIGKEFKKDIEETDEEVDEETQEVL